MKTKIQKREEVAIRQAEYAALSTEQKIARVQSRPGINAKELFKLGMRQVKEVAQK